MTTTATDPLDTLQGPTAEKDANASDPVPHLYERDRTAIRMCTCGRFYGHRCHEPFRAYEQGSKS